MLEQAASYLEAGWSVFPLHSKRQPAVAWKQYQERRPSLEEVVGWFGPYTWIGLALGAVSGLVRVDADGPEALRATCSLDGTTLSFSTPSGGRGYLYAYKPWMRTDVLESGVGHSELRFQSDGAYTVIPPSPGYTWLCTENIGPVPRWLEDKLLSRAARRATQEAAVYSDRADRKDVLEAVQHLTDEHADQYDTWIKVGMALRTLGEEYIDVWREFSQRSPKYRSGECEERWAGFRPDGRVRVGSIYYLAKANGYKPSYEEVTPLGFARVLAKRHGDGIRHSSSVGWYAWDGARWNQEDGEKRVQELQKEVLAYRITMAHSSLMRVDVSTEEGKKAAKRKLNAIAKIRAQETEPNIRGSRVLASSEPGVSIDFRDFDQQPWLFNCANGTIDLRTGELREHRQGDMLTQLCPVEYRPGAQPARWLQFVQEIFDGDASLIGWMRKFLGYCLTGSVQEHILPIFWGNARNGKGTLVETVQHVLGKDYATAAPHDLLVWKRDRGHPTELATLYGKRMVAAVETDRSTKFDLPMVKRLTGEDSISCRRLYEDYWEFTPTAKLLLATNHRPEIRGIDDAIRARLRLVPFTVSFLGREDRRLREKLRGEAEGILAWLVGGCMEWQRDGLGGVAAIDAPTRVYFDEQDPVAEFMATRCRRAPGSRVRCSAVSAAYRAYCQAEGKEPVAGRNLADALREHGVERDDDRNYYRGWEVSQ